MLHRSVESYAMRSKKQITRDWSPRPGKTLLAGEHCARKKRRQCGSREGGGNSNPEGLSEASLLRKKAGWRTNIAQIEPLLLLPRGIGFPYFNLQKR